MKNQTLMTTSSTRGTILFGHGSRDPLWRKPIEAVATHIQSIAPQAHVRCAYLEITVPDLPTSVAELAALGVTSITVIPMFLGVGRHAREDLPLLVTELIAAHPQVMFDLKPAIGEDAQMIELMARIALA
ncbi:MAG: CbiX/SirB N-terminal domain-containing protein [Rhodoferax sp.]|uniref:sirohydrochlorin chelatase n=1 Tax=Rhodoferax sp. TaxID=50421 RepID=UPI0030192BE2